MLILNSNITIGEWVFDYCVDVEIIQDIDTLTDTCKITIPRKTSWQGKNIGIGDDPVIKRGDAVVVKLGYDGSLKTRFIGYVKEVKAGMPVTIDCEDSMFLLKKGKLTFNFPGGDIRSLLDIIMPAGIKYKTPGDKSIAIPQFRFTNTSPARVLEELKSRMGLYCYFRNITTGNVTESILYVGLAYWTDNRNTETFLFGFNIIDPYDLVYKRMEDIRLKAKAISWQRNNTKIETEVGDEDGEQRTIHAYNLTLAQLQVYAKAQLERYKYTGYRGNLETFGEPAVEKNDIINLIGNVYHPDGKYLIKEVRIKSGVGGYRQSISPGQIINDTANSTGNPS